MMLWEYYSMIYVRARGSIVLFPRAALALFLMYHFYYFSFPAGFHVLALVTMFFFLVAVMVSMHFIRCCFFLNCSLHRFCELHSVTEYCALIHTPGALHPRLRDQGLRARGY